MSIQLIMAEAAKAAKERKEMRKRLAPFIKKTFATADPKAVYQHNYHIDLIAEYLEAMHLGQIRKLIINMPPGFLKTICASIAFPAWILGKDPRERILASSYEERLATRINQDCRKVMSTKWYQKTFPATKFARDQNEKKQFETTAGGFRKSCGTGGSITGEGGPWLFCDDALNPKVALSQVVMSDINRWYDETWTTRNRDPKHGKELVIMQRLSTGDLTDHLLSKGGWEHLVLQQVAEKKTILTFPVSKKKMVRPEGHILHESRFGEKEVAAAKTNLGSYGFAAQHQQTPVPRGGGLIKLEWFPRYKIEPSVYDETVFSIDTASGGKEINNPSVCQVYRRYQNRWHLVDTWKESVRYPELKAKIISLSVQYKPDAILIEDKSTGQALIPELENNEVQRMPIVKINPGKLSKEERVNVETPSMESGLIVLPDLEYIKADWLPGFELNLMAFPNQKDWDELDALSQFIKWTKKREATDGPIVIPHMQVGQSYWRM
jgi:predicted phage terminase large subunit-like protein